MKNKLFSITENVILITNSAAFLELKSQYATIGASHGRESWRRKI